MKLLLFLIVITKILSDNFLRFPTGEVPSECVHRWDYPVHIRTNEKGDEVRNESGELLSILPPCERSIRNVRDKSVRREIRNKNEENYYSGWVTYSGLSLEGEQEFSFMSAKWKVPEKLSKTSYFTSIYYFDGFEAHLHDTPHILQPVLAYGESGCRPITEGKYYIASFIVSGAGRAHCGKVFDVEVGDVIEGNLTMKGNRSWDVVTKSMSTGKTSLVSTQLDYPMQFACTTMEGIRVYSCDDYSRSNTVEFNSIELKIGEEEISKIEWDKYVKFDDCQQDMSYSDDGKTVNFFWNSTRKS